MKCFFSTYLIVGFLLSLVGNQQAVAQQFTYNGSAQYATGNYFFTERTGSFYLNNGMTVSGRGITLSINVPLVIQNSPWVSYSSHGFLPTGGPGNGTVDSGGRGGMGSGGRRIDPGDADTISYSKTGFSDPNLSGNFRLFGSTSGRTSVNGNFNLKFPLTEPEKGFGTGAWDMGAGISVAQRLGLSYLWLLDVMYWHLGDMEELNFNNPVSYSTGIGRVFDGAKWLLSANIYGYTKILDTADPPLSAGLSGGLRLSSKVRLNANLVIGLTESVSDFSAGFGWGLDL